MSLKLVHSYCCHLHLYIVSSSNPLEYTVKSTKNSRHENPLHFSFPNSRNSRFLSLDISMPRFLLTSWFKQKGKSKWSSGGGGLFGMYYFSQFLNGQVVYYGCSFTVRFSQGGFDRLTQSTQIGFKFQSFCRREEKTQKQHDKNT